MKKYFLRILELLFPSTEDEKTLTRVSTDSFISAYQKNARDEIVFLSCFSDPIIRAAIHLNKFHAHTRARELLTQLLIKYIETLPDHEYIIIPIPLSANRERIRGYNQIGGIAKAITIQNPHITFADKILIRTQNTVPQTSLPKEGRLLNIKGAFKVDPRQELRIVGTHIIVLDDVTTTGATLHEAKATLLPHHPKSVTCVALAG